MADSSSSRGSIGSFVFFARSTYPASTSIWRIMISVWVSSTETVFLFSMSFLFRFLRSFSVLNCRSSSATRCSEFLSCRFSEAASSCPDPESDKGLLMSGTLPPFTGSSEIGVLGQRGDVVPRVVSLRLLLWPDLPVLFPVSLLLFRPWRTAVDTRRRIDDEPSSVPRILAMSSSMLNSPPALQRGSLGDSFGSGTSPAELVVSLAAWVGGLGGARGCMYVSLSFVSGAAGRGGGSPARLDAVESDDGRGTSSSLRRESCEGLGGGALSTAPDREGDSVFAAPERASLLRGGAGGGLAGALMSIEVLDTELLLELASRLPFGASCNLNSSPGCAFAVAVLLSSAELGGALAFPFRVEGFRAGRSC